MEALHDLDQWIKNTERREKEGYDYVYDRYLSEKPVNKLTPKYRVQSKIEPRPVNILTPRAENFPKTPEEAKKKIEDLLKKVQKSA